MERGGGGDRVVTREGTVHKIGVLSSDQKDKVNGGSSLPLTLHGCIGRHRHVELGTIHTFDVLLYDVIGIAAQLSA